MSRYAPSPHTYGFIAIGTVLTYSHVLTTRVFDKAVTAVPFQPLVYLAELRTWVYLASAWLVTVIVFPQFVHLASAWLVIVIVFPQFVHLVRVLEE